MTDKQLPIIGPMQRTPEWYALRRNIDDPRFGGTDAAGLIGVSKWKSPRHIYEEFIVPPEPIDNEYTKTGNVMEGPICELYSDFKSKSVVRKLPCLLHPSAPLFASLDGIAWESEYPSVEPYNKTDAEWIMAPDGYEHALEVKWSMSPQVAAALGEEGSDYVPNEWACQVQQQMDVAVLEVAEIAVFLFGRLKVFRVPRNDDLIGCIHDAAQEMRERIINRDPPEPDWEHELTPELVRSMRHDIVGGSIECDVNVADFWNQQKECSKAIRELEARRDALKAQFEMWLIERDVAAGILPDGVKQVVRREQSRAGYTVGPKTFWEMREMKIK